MRCLMLGLLLAACTATPESSDSPPILNSDLHVVAGDFTCQDKPLTLPACATGVVVQQTDEGASHVPLPTAVSYTQVPPTSGPHRPYWGLWGEYSYMPPQVYLHNQEHGGVVVLYDPCVPPAEVQKLRDAIAQAKAAVAPQGLRYILTPQPGMAQPIMAAAWRWLYGNACVNVQELKDFIVARQGMAPENMSGNGTFQDRWLGY